MASKISVSLMIPIKSENFILYTSRYLNRWFFSLEVLEREQNNLESIFILSQSNLSHFDWINSFILLQGNFAVF